jgi:hypothetical protein
MTTVEQVLNRTSQVGSWREGMVVSHQAEGKEEPYQAAVGKVASYPEEGEILGGQGNQGAEA